MVRLDWSDQESGMVGSVEFAARYEAAALVEVLADGRPVAILPAYLVETLAAGLIAEGHAAMQRAPKMRR